VDKQFLDHRMTRWADHPILLLGLHGLDHLKQLGGVGHLDERAAGVSAADDVNRRRVLNSDLLPEFPVSIYFRSKLTLGIDHEWQIDFVLGRKPLREILQSIGSDLRLVLKNEIAELIA
jgi:hypothetical protein